MVIKCDYCGRFMSWDDVLVSSVTYIPYGDLNPPKERIHHGTCWDKAHTNLVRAA